MINIKLLLSVLTLKLWLVYTFLNVQSFLEGGSGSVFLALLFFVNFLLLFFQFMNRETVKIRNSLILMIIFFMYFVFKIKFDGISNEEIKQLTFGTSSGIVISFLIGISFAISFQNFSKYIPVSKFFFKAGSYLIIFTTLLYLLLIGLTFKSLATGLRVDKFLIEGDLNYQRPAILMGISYVSYSVYFLYWIFTKKCYFGNSKLLNVIMGLLYVLIAIFQSILSQVIGSNSGVLTTLSSMFITMSMFLVIIQKNWILKNSHFKISKIIKKGLIVALSFLFIGLLSIIYLGSEIITNSRLMGFGGKNQMNSGSSRLENFQKNVVDHISYNPLLGDFNVQFLAGDSGGYIHSFLISIQTHLGIIGLILILIYLVFLVFEMKYANKIMFEMHLKKGGFAVYFSYFLILIFIIFFLIANLTTFLHWMPMWFIFGFFTFSIRSN
jgi:hypothetical protein